MRIIVIVKSGHLEGDDECCGRPEESEGCVFVRVLLLLEYICFPQLCCDELSEQNGLASVLLYCILTNTEPSHLHDVSSSPHVVVAEFKQYISTLKYLSFYNKIKSRSSELTVQRTKCIYCRSPDLPTNS